MEQNATMRTSALAVLCNERSQWSRREKPCDRNGGDDQRIRTLETDMSTLKARMDRLEPHRA
jgi:hypothetical protein